MSLKGIIDWLFKKHPSLAEVYGDKITTVGNFIGSLEITIGFLVIGLVFVFISPKTAQEPARKQRIAISKLIGWALVCCGIARSLEALAIWHHYGNLRLVIKNITGIIGLIVVTYIPYILRIMKKQVSIEEVKKTMDDTSKKVEELKDLTKKIDNL